MLPIHPGTGRKKGEVGMSFVFSWMKEIAKIAGEEFICVVSFNLSLAVVATGFGPAAAGENDHMKNLYYT